MACSVLVEGHDVAGEARPYAVYRLLVVEDGREWRIRRRWNDLRILVADLNEKHGKELRESGVTIPKFSSHGFRLAHQMLELKFLNSRAAAMQSLLHAYISALPISLLSSTGPEPLLCFLSADLPDAGVQPTPAATPRATVSAAAGWGGVDELLSIPEGGLAQAATRALSERSDDDARLPSPPKVAPPTAPVKGVLVAEAAPAPALAIWLIWSAVVLVPVLALAARQML
ncbi:hypothetical protein EMIHUDRAFT_226550 [Emiliania huxleyi CCMP1516]|uniref:PX domain-containing protein n=3 Tax=Emiliania huxleyi TaxID=2903 RepID=A0A0D3KKH3_EMIH1|nr:hypothetical protein EMIHUDRAFT_226550 [Emiliania huxleyi CCMP1516]EOD36258.1 hypothetical protein EMIHUDRAFT_226550 [Emiliania huxleyi CCMP1516]|mmetsp:Transcript_25432/g.81323  ORF Transcript_25432/g.81323 Transcript_25432/m.81323 type:complete len:229 (-) Transcript_25432:243-929(-)|eukprot:XP_005788687.1 hypothetical protein EMIHUDRAFT_226550 [Emiliania huxleyi CCMP1516]